MPAATPVPAPAVADTVKRVARRRAVEESNLPESTKFLLIAMQDHADDEVEVNRTGHAATAAAIEKQTTRFVQTVGAGIGLGFVVIVLVIVMLGESRGVDTSRATDSTVKVLSAASGAPTTEEK